MVAYIFFRSLAVIFSVLPWIVVYAISFFLSGILRLIVRYRRSMVRSYLRLSFPSLTSVEYLDLEKKIYQNFCDVIVENIKSFSVSKQFLRNRVKVENPECLRQYLDLKKSCICYLPHFANWEWAGAVSLYFSDQVVGVYKPVHNRRINDFVLQLRRQWGLTLIKAKDFPRTISRHVRQSSTRMPLIYALLADQNPVPNQAVIRLDFLNRSTPFLLAPEKIARHYDLPLVYVSMSRIKRGYYSLRFIPVEVGDRPVGEPTRDMVAILEAQITAQPEHWLWMHNRWKKR